MKFIRPQVMYHAFCDESTYNVGKYHAFAVVSLPEKNVPAIKGDILNLLIESSVHEFSWKNLNGARMRFCAIKLLDYTVKQAKSGALRVDVLIWDSSDSRHNIKGRDDIGNMERMYYHLFVDIIRKRWPLTSEWKIFPDEQTAIKWDTVKEVLCNAGLNVTQHAPKGVLFRLDEYPICDFDIMEITQFPSSDEVLIQVADLFSGLAVYSRNTYDKYSKWERSLEADPKERLNLSKSDNARCAVLRSFDKACKENKLGVSLKTHKGLITLRPVNPINFWLYKPQTEKDKAPIKIGRTNSP